MRGIRPDIIIKTYNPNTYALKEILAGIEEEGILYSIMDEEAYKDSQILATEAANMSKVEVGIGLNKEIATLYVHKVIDVFLFETNKDFRTIGQNSGKYVKGNPLILLDRS